MTLLNVATGATVEPLEIVPHEPREPRHRPTWLFTNMVSSMDGAAAVDGLSGPMGDADDQAMFRSLRASADAIVVGAGTVNAERYRAPQRSAEVDASRAAAGRQPRPIIAVISASFSVDPTLDLFADPTYRPIIFTSRRSSDDPASRKRRASLADRADIVEMGEATVDLTSALDHLGSLGHRSVLSEGGPTLNGQLISDGLVDEWNLTVAPLLVGGDAPRTAHHRSGDTASLEDYEVARVWKGERSLFLRWVRTAPTK